jgi:hypothetical protein
VLALPPIVFDGHRTCARQVPNRLVRLVGNPQRCQFAGPQQASQGLCIRPICLYPLARPTRYQRRRNNHTCMTKSQDLAIQPIAFGTSPVADVQLLMTPGQLTDQLRYGIRCIVKLTQIPDFPSWPLSATATAFRTLALSILMTISPLSSWLVPYASRLGPAHPGNPRSTSHTQGEPPQPLSKHAVLP